MKTVLALLLSVLTVAAAFAPPSSTAGQSSASVGRSIPRLGENKIAFRAPEAAPKESSSTALSNALREFANWNDVWEGDYGYGGGYGMNRWGPYRSGYRRGGYGGYGRYGRGGYGGYGGGYYGGGYGGYGGGYGGYGGGYYGGYGMGGYGGYGMGYGGYGRGYGGGYGGYGGGYGGYGGGYGLGYSNYSNFPETREFRARRRYSRDYYPNYGYGGYGGGYGGYGRGYGGGYGGYGGYYGRGGYW